MTKPFFTNLQSIAMRELRSAEKSVKAAIAWINFCIYEPIFMELLCRKVKVRLIINDDKINQRYAEHIKRLRSHGAEIRMVRYAGIMHHKFCIIDNKKCIFGSFNLTESADKRNIEDLNICDEDSFVNSYRLEFNALCELSKSDIALLEHPPRCPFCNAPRLNIMLMEPDGDYLTKVTVIEKCGCGEREVFSDFYDVSVYNNYVEILDYYQDRINEAEGFGESPDSWEETRDFYVSRYFSAVRTDRMQCPIIHAVGIRTFEFIKKHDDYECYRIIWKERGTEAYIENEYPID